jgi:hypothetical protein
VGGEFAVDIDFVELPGFAVLAVIRPARIRPRRQGRLRTVGCRRRSHLRGWVRRP